MGNQKEWSKKYHEKNKERINKRTREHLLYVRYGITVEDRNRLIQEQNNRCLICKETFNETYLYSPTIDHCHKTGKVRGILCRNCNSMIGYAKDTIATLQSGIIYLNRYRF